MNPLGELVMSELMLAEHW